MCRIIIHEFKIITQEATLKDQHGGTRLGGMASFDTDFQLYMPYDDLKLTNQENQRITPGLPTVPFMITKLSKLSKLIKYI